MRRHLTAVLVLLSLLALTTATACLVRTHDHGRRSSAVHRDHGKHGKHKPKKPKKPKKQKKHRKHKKH